MKRALYVCELVLNPGNEEALSKKIKLIDEWLLEQSKPRNFDPNDSHNDVANIINSFEFLCANLEDFGVHEPNKMTVRRFYSRLRYYKKKHSKQGSTE